MQETWLELDEFIALSGLEKNKILELVEDGVIKSRKKSDGSIQIEAESGAGGIVKKMEGNIASIEGSGIRSNLEPMLVERTIGTILALHDKVVSSKNETISAFKNENGFLKDAVISMQEIYDSDKKTIEVMSRELEAARDEIDMMKKKYKLMWGKVLGDSE